MKLIDIARILRSKNAGPLYITFDIMLESSEKMKMVERGLTREAVAEAYRTRADQVEIHVYKIVNSIKITMPRRCVSGSLFDDDVYGCQQHVPLGNIEISTED